MRSGRDASNSSMRLCAVGRHDDVEPLAVEPDPQRVDEGLLVLDEQDERPHLVSLRGPSSSASLGVQRQDERERGALALAGLHLDATAVVLGDVAGDREPEPRAAGLARATRVHAVEALEDPVEVLRGMPMPLSVTEIRTVRSTIGDGAADSELLGSSSASVTSARRVADRLLADRRVHRHRAALRRVRDAVLEQRAERRDQLAAVAEDDHAGLGLFEDELDVALVGRGRGSARSPRP